MLNYLSLENFKSIKDENFEFRSLNIFTGFNGMGKSSALQSLLLLRQSHDKLMIPNVGLSLTGEYVKIGIGKDLLYIGADEEKIKIEAYWDESSVELYFDYSENSDMQPIIPELSSTEGNPFSESLFVSNFQYLSAERISPKSVYDVSEFAVNQRRSLGIRGEYTAHFLSQHGGKNLFIENLQHPQAKSSHLIDNLNAWMSEITPGVKIITKLIPEINQASLHYQFASATEYTNEFRPENTGFGLTYVLPVVTALLCSKPGDLLIIENPESHLHPSGQSLIGKLIALASQNGVQIAIETHSDHIINGVRAAVKNKDLAPENVIVYFLSRDLSSAEHCTNVEKIEINQNGKIDYWPEGFFDEWDKSLNILLKD